MFQGMELRTLLYDQLSHARASIDQIDSDALLAENPDVIVGSLISTHIPADIRVEWESASRSPVIEVRHPRRDPFDGTPYNVAASKVTVSFPIEGDGHLFSYQASRFSLAPDPLPIAGNAVQLEVVSDDLTADLITQSVDRLRRDVDKRSEWINSDLQAFRVEAAISLRSAIEARRKRVLAHRELDAALTIPVHTTGATRRVVPARPKQISLETRRQQHGFVPEPVLEESIYQDVLSQVRSWSRTMERVPRTAQKLDEEELRDLILGVLNAYWAGAAGGELFNGAGKTDILIREGDRNAFIAECKIWTGPKAVAEAIEQLLSYLVWRDSKAALVYFIRTADPQATTEKLIAAVEAHPKHVLTIKADPAACVYEYVFAADDEGRRISLAVIPVVLGQRS